MIAQPSTGFFHTSIRIAHGRKYVNKKIKISKKE